MLEEATVITRANEHIPTMEMPFPDAGQPQFDRPGVKCGEPDRSNGVRIRRNGFERAEIAQRLDGAWTQVFAADLRPRKARAFEDCDVQAAPPQT